MQSIWQINDREKLLLFFSGWGMDERPTAHLEAGEYDVCTCFHYSDLQSAEWERWKAYGEVTVVAWSMGVWAAERLLAGSDLKISRAIAVNGTPKPVDDRYGIPTAVAQATLDGLTPDSLRRFYRRMAGGGGLLRQLEEGGRLPRIDFAERKEELARILAQGPYPDTGFAWNQAIVCTQDAIFPPENLRAAWRGKAVVRELDAPHYPFHRFGSWEEVADV